MFKKRDDSGQVERKFQKSAEKTDREEVGRIAQIVNNSMRSLPKRHLSIGASPQYLIGEIESLEELLKDYSVADVKNLIKQIEDDRSVVHYHSKENTIQNVIFNQPHNTNHFYEYYYPTRKPIRRRHYVSSFGFYFVATFFSYISGSITAIPFMEYHNYETVILTATLTVGTSLAIIINLLIARSPLYFMRKNGRNFAEDLYGSIRHNSTLCGYHEKVFEREEKAKSDKLEKLKSQAESLNKSLAVYDPSNQIDTSNAHYTPRRMEPQKPAPVVPDLSEVKSDYDKAVAVITSYELDIIKAVKYPAFNDITVDEVREMHMLLKDAGRAIKAEDTMRARKLVDRLTLAVKAAERTAMRLAWSDMTESEQKDLQLAQNLIIQVNDTGNTEEMRAVLYERLRKVVERLNSTHIIVPKSTVVLIEERSRKELTQN